MSRSSNKNLLKTRLLAVILTLAAFLLFSNASVSAQATELHCRNPAGPVPAGQDAIVYCSDKGGIDYGQYEVFGIGSRGECGVSESFFGFPTWFKYLQGDNINGQCEVSTIKTAGETDIGKTGAAIGMAIFEIILRLAGMVAVGLVIFGGFKYTLSQGEPDQLKGARTTIINALVGAVIVAVAVPVVNVIGGNLAGAPGGGLPTPSTTGSGTILQAIRLAATFIGAISVIMVVIGGIKYVTSQGNPQETSKAKDTIMYALIGVIIAAFATPIVSFVLGGLG